MADIPVYTIGYGHRSFSEFVGLLQQYGIKFLVDIRSQPYSRFKPEFSKEQFEKQLKQCGIRYVFMGDTLGGRPKDSDCYIDGKVDYEQLRQKTFYHEGIDRVRTAWEKQLRFALMCAEAKPEECHRGKLIGNTLVEQHIAVVHIDETGKVKTQDEVNQTLTSGQLPLFDSSSSVASNDNLRFSRKASTVPATATAGKDTKPKQAEPIIHGSQALQRWLHHYWQKLQLPAQELSRLTITQDRQEFMRWTGKRLNPMILGCYCYLPGARTSSKQVSKSKLSAHAPSVKRAEDTSPLQSANHRHLIFIEPDMQPQSIEVTIAHELIHLADQVNGTPRRHRHHGHDSIAADEAAITGYGLEELRQLLHEESTRRERMRREHRPIRYLYECPNCGKEYPRTRRYSQAVSCSGCDKAFNPQFRLRLRT